MSSTVAWNIVANLIREGDERMSPETAALAIDTAIRAAVERERERFDRICNNEVGLHKQNGDYQRADAVRWVQRVVKADIDTEAAALRAAAIRTAPSERQGG